MDVNWVFAGRCDALASESLAGAVSITPPTLRDAEGPEQQRKRGGIEQAHEPPPTLLRKPHALRRWHSERERRIFILKGASLVPFHQRFFISLLHMSHFSSCFEISRCRLRSVLAKSGDPDAACDDPLQRQHRITSVRGQQQFHSLLKCLMHNRYLSIT